MENFVGVWHKYVRHGKFGTASGQFRQPRSSVGYNSKLSTERSLTAEQASVNYSCAHLRH